MKLVDILARELVQWPPEAVAIAQDIDGAAYPYDSQDIDFNDGEWYGEDAGVMTASYNVKIDCRAEDYTTSIVTRAQWQAAVDALKSAHKVESPLLSMSGQVVGRVSRAVEWDGSGLPPVGVTCWFGDENEELRIIAHLDQGEDAGEWRYLAVGQRGEFGSLSLAVAGHWKPIRTPEQIAAEEREISIRQIEDDLCDSGVGRDVRRAAAESLHDMGYRKQEPK